MVTINEYFDGNVKSLGFEETEGKASVGVMTPGEYEFSTSTREVMTVISGELVVKLPGSKEWKSFPAGAIFKVADNEKFQLKVSVDTAYLCQYS